MIKNIRHTALVVEDINLALEFYRDILELKVVSSQRLSGKYIETLLHYPGVNITYKKLAIPEGGLIELIQFHNVYIVANLDFNHIAFTVDNIQKVYDKLISHDIEPLSAPITDPEGKNRLFFCEDYDGNLIEFVEEL